MSDPSPPPEPALPEPGANAVERVPAAEKHAADTAPVGERSAAEPAPGVSGTSRRWFLAGGAAVLIAGGAGVAVERLGRSEPAGPPTPPTALVAAVHAERVLIADLDATTGGTPRVRAMIAQARADHAAHLSALRGVLAGY